MIKIAFGVQGTGNGHISRARIMAKAFAERNDVDVDFIFSGRAPEKYFDMECFGQYQTFSGLSFEVQAGKISHAKTIRNARPRQLWQDIQRMDLSRYDLVINDFEPITAWAAKRQGIPSMSISHQAAFALGAPQSGANFIDKLIMRYFAPTDIQLGVHWFHFGRSIVPPFVFEKPSQQGNGDYVLVYLPFEDIDDIKALLEPVSEHRFVCFHPNVSKPYTDEHIEWQPTSVSQFKPALIRANGVIANAGFELSSEALRLGKKLLLKPLSGQFEQLSNAHTLQQLELCDIMFRLDTDSVEDWLNSGPIEPIHFPDDPHVMVDWIVKKNWENTQPLCDALWKQVKFPDQTRQKLMTLAF